MSNSFVLSPSSATTTTNTIMNSPVPNSPLPLPDQGMPVLKQQISNKILLKCGKGKDCRVFDEDHTMILLNKPEMKMLMTGCWGVYGKEGETDYSKLSYKDGKLGIKTEKVIFGAQRVGNEMAKQGEVDAVILAGDNVYSKSMIESEIAKINQEFQNYKTEEDKEIYMDKIKAELHNFIEQYEEGFQKIIKNVNTRNFFIAIGNHDAKTCLNLSQEMDPSHAADGWLFPALSYTQTFQLSDGTAVNLIFIDTNVYDFDENHFAVLCSEYDVVEENRIKRTDYGYTKTFRENQMEWVKHVLKPNAWNIIIGHIPPIMAPHKPKSDMYNKVFYEDMAKLKRESQNLIHLYLCADEHNQQFIQDRNVPPVAIVGSGGNHLDPIFVPSNLMTQEKILFYAKSVHGFVSLSVNANFIDVIFYSPDTPGCTIRIDKMQANAVITDPRGSCEIENSFLQQQQP